MISILTPAYIDTIEKLEWLNEMVRSVQDQIAKEWEIILIDDASPVPINLQEPDNRVRILRTSGRSGPSLCRNTAAALARYDALLPIDADDVLPTPDTLGVFYSAFQADPGKVYYGDLQHLEKLDGRWQRGKVVGLHDYTFQNTLLPGGVMPVTAMHSARCHQKAGGWKAELDAAFEDVEYWIAAGKAGFCGQMIKQVTLLYRKHEDSRYGQLRDNPDRQVEMVSRIRELHNDVYGGNYPMGCCGGGKPYIPPESYNASSVSMPATLDQYPGEMKVWVEYAGQRDAGFGLVGPFTRYEYKVDGPGHKLEVHLNDLPKFRSAGRGIDFKIGVPPPNGHVPAPTPAGPQPWQGNAPEMAQILQLDPVALG